MAQLAAWYPGVALTGQSELGQCGPPRPDDLGTHRAARALMGSY